jgi:hypothetical protein
VPAVQPVGVSEADKCIQLAGVVAALMGEVEQSFVVVLGLFVSALH